MHVFYHESLRNANPNKTLSFSFQSAERCCTCTECGTETQNRVDWLLVCETCEPAMRIELNKRHEEFAIRNARGKLEKDESLAKARDTRAALELLERMSDVSEDEWCAGWLIDLEYTLWDAIVNRGSTKLERIGYGLSYLKELSDRCGGWWKHGDNFHEIFVDIETWRDEYNAYVARCSAQKFINDLE